MANTTYNVKVGFQEDPSGLNKIKQDLQEIQRMAKDVEFTGGFNPKQLASMTQAAHTLEAALDAAFDVNLNTVNIQKFNSILKQSGTSIQQIQQGLAHAGAIGESAFLRATGTMMKFNTAVKQSSQFLDSLSTTFVNTIKWSAMSSIINNISNGIRNSFYYVKDLDTALNDIRIVTGKSADEMERFAINANNTAKQLAVTTKEYTKGSLIYYQQGLDDETVKTLTDITAKTSNVTGQGMDVVSEHLTAVWNGYRVANEAAEEGMGVYEEYVDKMAAVGAATASDLEELSIGMSKVASAAKSMGVDFDDLNAQIATIVSVTRQAPESVGTALKTIYARLGDLQVDGVDEFGVKLGEVSGKLQTMGVDILDVNGDMRDMTSVMAEVAGKWDTWTESQRQAAAVAMAGKRQYNNLIALFDNWDKYNDALEVSENALGTLNKQQEIALDSLSNKLDILKASAEDVYANLFDEESLKKLVDLGSSALSIIADLVGGMGGLNGILWTLGGTALNVFSNQIASGLSKFTTNLLTAKEAAAVAQQNFQELQALNLNSNFLTKGENSNSGALQKEFSSLKDYYTDMYKYQGLMNQEEKEQYNNIINQKIAAGDLAFELESSLKTLDKSKEAGKVFATTIEGITDTKGFTELSTKIQDFTNIVSTAKDKFLNEGAKSFDLDSFLDSLDKAGIKTDILNNKFLELCTTGADINEVIEQFFSYLEQLGIPANEIENLKQKLDILKGSVDSAGDAFKNKMDWKSNYQGTIQLVGGIGQLASAMKMVSNIKNIINNDQLSIMEKTLQITTSLTMSFTMLASGISAVVKGGPALKALFLQITMQLLGVKTAEEVTAAAAAKAWLAMLGPYALVVAAIAAVGFAIYEAIKAWNAAEEAAKEAEERAKQLKESYEELKTAYEELKNSLEDYKEAKNALDELVQGTETWKTAVQELNEQVLELLKAFPSLANYITNNNGILEISEEGQEEIIKQNQKATQDAYRQQLLANIQASDKQIDYTADKLSKKMPYIYTPKTYAVDPMTGETIETDDVENTTVEFLSTGQIRKIFDIMDIYGTDIIKNAESIQEHTKVTKEAADVITKNNDIILSSYYKAKTQEKAKNLNASVYGKEYLANAGYGSPAYAEQLGMVIGNKVQAKYDELLPDYEDGWFWSGGGDKERQKQYADAHDNVQFLSNKGDNQGLYLVDGKEKTIDDAIIRSSLAMDAAEEAVQEEIEQTIKDFNEVAALVDDESGKASDNVKNALVNIVSDINNIDELTGEEITKLASADFTKLNEDILTRLGITNAEELNATKDSLVASWNEFSEKLSSSMLDNAHDAYKQLEEDGKLKDKTFGDRKFIAETLNQAEAYGKLNEAIEAFNTGKLEEFADTIVEIPETLEELSARYADIHKFMDKLSQGDILKAEDVEKLKGVGSEYLTYMLDGTYKLTGNAKDFYDAVQGSLVKDYRKQIDNLIEKNNTYESIQGYDFTKLSSQNYQRHNNPYESEYTYNTEQIQQQIDIIKTLGNESATTVEMWQQKLSKGENFTLDELNQITEAVNGCSDSFNGLSSAIKANHDEMFQIDMAIASSYDNLKDLKQALDDETISIDAFNAAAANLDKVKDLEGLDANELSNFADYLKETAKASDDLADTMTDSASQIVAKGIMKMNAGIDLLANNWDDWSKIIEDSSSSSAEFAEAAGGMKDALSKLLDVSKDYIDSNFIKDNLEDIKKAAEGDAEAIDTLKEALIKPIVAKIALDNDISASELTSSIANLQSIIDGLGDLKVGVEVEDSSFLTACNAMIDNAKLTTDQVNAIFDAMGFETEFVEEDHSTSHRVPRYVTHHEITNRRTEKVGGTGVTGTETEVETYDESTWTEQQGYEDVQGTVPAFAMGTNGATPHIKSVTKKASGSSNNYSSANSGGTKSPGGKAKKGGGGGGKKKDKEKKNYKDEFDRYWEIKKAIDSVDHSLNRLEKDKKNLYGYQLIDALKYENQLLEKQKGHYEQLLAAQEMEAAELRNQLGTMGVMFDASGAIINYAEATAKALAAYNAAIQQYNAGLIDETTFGIAENAFKNFKELLSRYDTLYYKEMQDTMDKLDDIRREELENNLKAWEVEIQLKLDLKELKRGWNDFLTEIQKDFQKVYDDLTVEAKRMVDDAKTYIGSDGSIATIINAIHDVTHEIDVMNGGGESSMFESISQAQEKLKELNDQLQDAARGLHDLWKEAWDNYLNGIDQVADKLDDLMDQFEKINDELEFQKELIELIYGEDAYELMDTLFKGQEKSTSNQIQSLKTQADMWHQLWLETGATMENQENWNEDQRKYYDEWMEAQSDLNDLVIDYIKLLKDDYINAVKKAIKELDNAITGSSLERVQTQWERISAYSDKYLDDVEKAYNIQKFANEIDESIAKLDNLKQQQKLQELREKEINYLREKEHLTQYDLDAAEARYQIALKEMALEDAQNNKTSMKLVRNEEGNWAYQYMADADDVASKRQELLDAFNELYQLASDAYEANIEAALEVQQHYEEQLEELRIAQINGDEEAQQKITELEDWYEEQRTLLIEENQLYRNDLRIAGAAILLEVYEQDAEAYGVMTETEQELVDSLTANSIEDYMQLEEAVSENIGNIGALSAETMTEIRRDWGSTAQALVDFWNKDEGGSVRYEIQVAYQKMEEANNHYRTEIDNLAKTVERDFGPEGIKGAIEKAANATDGLNSKTQQLVNDGVAYLAVLKQAVDMIAAAWQSVQQEIINAIGLLEKYINMIAGYNAAVQEHNAQVAAAQQAAIDAANGGGGGGSKGTSPDSSNNGQYWTQGDRVKYHQYTGSGVTNGSGYQYLREHAQDIANNEQIKAGKAAANAEQLAKLYHIASNATGGYTGSWSGGDTQGKLAFLHQKELVLNKDDTSNFLQGINTIRDLSNLNGSISGAIMSSIAGMVASMISPKVGVGSSTVNNNEDNSSGNVFNITAEFPNANDVNEIREAIMSLPNLASQYIARNLK